MLECGESLIVIDTRRTPLDYETIEKKVLFEINNRPYKNIF